MLIISTVKEVPDNKPHAIVRAIFLIPGFLCAIILASSGVDIITQDSIITNTITAVNTTEVFTEAITTSSSIELLNPIWITFHFLIAIVLAVYIIYQVLILLMKV